MSDAWPKLDWASWAPTGDTLHMWLQIVGKYRLAHAPWLNHAWHATFYPTPEGLTTGPVPDANGTFEVRFDFRDHALLVHAPGGAITGFDLEAMSVADFWDRFSITLSAAGAAPTMHHAPNEVTMPVPFREQTAPQPYDAAAVRRFYEAMLCITPVFETYRTGFVGKSSPTHLFWGSFDLAVTRFSGRPAPLHPGGFPALPDAVTQEAYSHEVASAGFWPGNGGGPIQEPCFYAYAYPTPDGFADAVLQTSDARFDNTLGEFVLPYAAVQTANDPAAHLLSFLNETYAIAADLTAWDRLSLECPMGKPRVPRPVIADAPEDPAASTVDDVQREETGSKGRYVLRDAATGAEAEMTYSRANERLIIIDHTDVPDALRGRGLARKLAEAAVEDARTRGHKIIPLCPFLAAERSRHPDWSAVFQ